MQFIANQYNFAVHQTFPLVDPSNIVVTRASFTHVLLFVGYKSTSSTYLYNFQKCENMSTKKLSLI